MGNPLFLYDGVCGLCHRVVQFILRRDSKGRFRFASLQSEFAARALARHGANAADFDTVYVIVNCDSAAVRVSEERAGEELLARSDAALFVLRELGGVWQLGAWLLECLPRSLRDWGYSVIARNRYRVFGRYETCPVPDERVRSRFLDL